MLFPLSLPQRDVYFEQQLFPDSPIYNIGAKIEIRGEINMNAMKLAFLSLISQHDTFRSTILIQKDEPFMKVHQEVGAGLEFIDFDGLENSNALAEEFMQTEFAKPFNLSEEKYLHKFILIKVDESFYYLFSVYHHIITDGWGTSLMFKRFTELYNDILQFGDTRHTYSYPYTDFISFNKDYQNGHGRYTEDQEYWENKFCNIQGMLINAKLYDTENTLTSERTVNYISRSLYNNLDNIAQTAGVSTFNILLATVYCYLGRIYDSSDLTIGLPVLNRSSKSFKKTVGLFMCVNPLRIYLDFDCTFRELLLQIKQQLREDYRHQGFPLSHIARKAKGREEGSQLFDVTFSYEKHDYSSGFGICLTKVIPLTHKVERVPLAIYVREFDESQDIKIDFDYNINYFNADDVSQLVECFNNILKQVAEGIDFKINKLQFLKESDQIHLIKDFNNTFQAYSESHSITDLIDEKASQVPLKVALKDEFKFYSYSDLTIISNKIAQFLNSKYSADRQSPIAIMVNRSADMIAVLLGIIKSGRPYLPLDPTFPQNRLKYILEDSTAQLLICDSEIDIGFLTSSVGTVVKIDEVLNNVNSFNFTGSKLNRASNELAYIIYTSGSTGNPKGVEIKHSSVVNFLLSMKVSPGMNDGDILLSVTTYSFDISVLEFFLPLISGGTVFIASKETLSNPNLLIQLIDTIEPDIIQATPSFFQMLFNTGWRGKSRLKVLCGGDLLSEPLAEKLINSVAEVWNMYGPTETTIWSSIKLIKNTNDASIIGKPINNTKIFILDNWLNLMPIGTAGEIYIGGHGLAKGYHKNAELTSSRFIKSPFDKYEKIYRTGDIGKWDLNGEIQIFGRVDNQVKIRGYRIELAEIEHQILKSNSISDAVVLPVKEEDQNAYLIAYVTLKNQSLNLDSIFDFLKRTLPGYMIPISIDIIKEFPLTPNKKVDRNVLLKKHLAKRSSIVDTSKGESLSELENVLRSIWEDVLNFKNINVDDNFFALGGHSLIAIKLISLIKNNLGTEINLKCIFDNPTIRLLAIYLTNLNFSSNFTIPIIEKKEFYNITSSQYKLWMLSLNAVTSKAYNMTSAYLFEGDMNEAAFEAAFKLLIFNNEIFRTNFIEIDGSPYQIIRPFSEINFFIQKHLYDNDKNQNLGLVVNNIIDKKFKLDEELLLKIDLIRVSAHSRIIVFNAHHIIMDGWSLGLLLQQLSSIYNTYLKCEIPIYNTKLQFKDYAEWSILKYNSEISINKNYWIKKLHDYKPFSSFLKDTGVETPNSYNGDILTFDLGENLTHKLKEFSKDNKTTIYAILATALYVLIYKYSKNEDICIGTVFSDRENPELSDLIGLLINTVALRTCLNSSKTFQGNLKNVEETISQSFQHQNYSIELIKNINGVQYPIFDTMIVFQKSDVLNNFDEFSELKAETYSTDHKYSRFPITFNFYEEGSSLKCNTEYNTDFYDIETVNIITKRFIDLLNKISENSEMIIDKYKLSDTHNTITENQISFNF